MKPQISTIIDPNKLSECLGVKWSHEKIYDECFDKPELIILENTFSIRLENSIRLSFIIDLPNEVNLFIDNNKRASSIHFKNISQVLYNPKLKLVILESKNSEFFSQLRVDYSGNFDLSTQNPISNYANSWLSIMGENLQLIEFNPQTKNI